MPGTFAPALRPRAALLAAALVAGNIGGYTLTAAAQRPLTAEEKKVIGERLAPAVNYTRNLTLEEGGTIFVVHTLRAPVARVRGGSTDYEGLILKAQAPAGVVVQRRIDQVKVVPAGGQAEITFRYAIHVEPGTREGGAVELTLSLIERTGFANAVASAQLKHRVKVVDAKPTTTDLTADFRGYRVYKALAEQQITALSTTGVRGLSVDDTGDLPRLDRLDPAKVEKVYDVDRWRRRMGVARRHLRTAAASTDRAVAALARKYLELLDAPENKLGSLPVIALAPGGAEDAEVETLTPESSEPVPAPPPPKPKTGKDGVAILVPLDQQGSRPRAEADQFAPRPEEPKTPVAANDAAPPAAPAPGDAPLGEEGFVRLKETPIPLYPRSLVLDDPNLGHGGWVRFSYARVALDFTATTPAWFIGAQAAVTRDIGVELIVPTAYVSLDLERSSPAFTLGNPLLSAKYRLHLPEVEGRRPVLTLRARWGIPISPQHTIARTDQVAEAYTLPAYFADTYAFMLERNDLGLGVNAAWQTGMFHLAAQLYGDFFFPVSGSAEKLEFFALGYGASIGVRPFDELVGFYLEGRGATLFTGPIPREFFAYLGARGHFADYFEPALWVALPIGSVGSVGSLQVGAELRFSYDVEGVIVRGRGRSDRFIEDRAE